MKIKSGIILSVLFLFSNVVGESLVFPPYLHSYGIRKATPKHLFMFFGASTHFSDPQGLATTKMDSWDNPATKKDDDEVIVYGVNSGQHELIYNTSMFSLALFGKKGSGIDCFMYPKGIAINSKGDVYVADSGNNRIVHLFNPKANLKWVGAFNGETKSNEGLIGPLRVGLDEDGNIYATDAVHKKIFVFTKNEMLQGYIPKNNKELFVDKPTALAIADGNARWSYYKNERVVFCADNKARRLWKIDLSGEVLKSTQLPDGYNAFYGTIDFYHNYWITDIYKHCILKYDHDLNLLDIFGSYGDKKDQFIEPRGIAIYKRFGQVFVAEKKGAQYYWVGTQLKSTQLKNYDNEKYTLTVKSTEYSFVTLLSIRGKDTINYIKSRMIFPGTDFINFTDDDKKLKNYSLFLKIEPTYSSYTYNSWTFPIEITNR